MLVPNRHGSSNSYRYGFQGQEKDDELKGEGNSLNYTFRMHDPRVGRFFATDPLEKKYPELTPYQFSSNTPIMAVELEGLESSANPNKEGKTDSNEKSLFQQLINDPEEALISFSEGFVSMLPDSPKLSMFSSPEELESSGSGTLSAISGLSKMFGLKPLKDVSEGKASLTEIPSRMYGAQSDFGGSLYNSTSTSFGGWINNMSSGDLSKTSYGLGQFAFTATSFYGSEITTAEGFLFGGINMKAPFRIPVQRFGNMNLKRPDFWGVKIGKNRFINRAFSAIKTDWNSLDIYTTGYIPKGAQIKVGITGPQSGGFYPGGSIQFIVDSKLIENQNSIRNMKLNFKF